MSGEIGQISSTDELSLPSVYVAMVGDIVHAGHINVLNSARSLGRVIVGVLTDEAAASYKRVPFLPFEHRKLVVENMAGVECVVAQNTLSYRHNLMTHRPDYVVHGDDWRYGVQMQVRAEVIELLALWGGELVEVKYTEGISSTLLHEALRERSILAQGRQKRLRSMLAQKPLVRVLEVHSPLAAVIAERAQVEGRKFDGFWSSSLADSMVHGTPDIEVLDHQTRINSLLETMHVTNRPVIYDGDSGGSSEALHYLCKKLECTGISAVCLEDKCGRKSNSLYGQETSQKQASIEDFTAKIRAARSAVPNSAMMIVARIESLVLGHPIRDALARADAYCKAGADAILIHSVAPTAHDVLTFADSFEARGDVPLFVVPTTYACTYEQELIEHGINCVIYANHLVRASYRAMERASNDILKFTRADELSSYSASPKELLDTFPEPA